MKKPEENLSILLQEMKPVLNKGEYVFITMQEFEKELFNKSIMIFRENEGITVIVSKKIADNLSMKYESSFLWITLQINSSLNAIGFTAIFSSELAKYKISCNVVAGYYHDHIFVDSKDGNKAIRILNNLSIKANPI